MVTRNEKIIDRAVQIFAQLLGQEIASSRLTPKDTAHMARTFATTGKVINSEKGLTIRYTTPFYTEYVNNGTKNKNGSTRIKARHFIQKIFNQKAGELLAKSFRIANTQFK